MDTSSLRLLALDASLVLLTTCDACWPVPDSCASGGVPTFDY